MHMKYKKTKSETVNTSDNMTPPSGMPQGTPPAKPDGDTNGGPGGSAPGGSGIGLSVAKSIVTLHGGTIHAKSDDGKKIQNDAATPREGRRFSDCKLLFLAKNNDGS